MQQYHLGTHSGEQLATFRLAELVGAGGAAEVYRGTDLTLGREVAVKVLPAELNQDRGFTRRFREEAMRVATLDHPHVVPVYYYGEERGHLFLVMPLVRGGSLRQRLRREKRLQPEEAVRIALDVASALEAAHSAHLIHRDVKPENILFNSHGDALLTDFGLARDLPEGSDVWAQHNTTGIYGIPVGTPEYMAPEQFRRNTILDQRVDIYALGVVLYEMLTGRLPFTGSPRQLADRVTSQLCPRPSSLVPSIWPALDPRVMTALAPSPQARYGSAAEFAVALRQTASAYTTNPGDVTILETQPTAVVAAEQPHTAELPAYFRLPTPPELLEPEPWPTQPSSATATVRSGRMPRLALLLAAVLLLASVGTGSAVLLANALGSASAPKAIVSPTIQPPTATPTRRPRPTATATTAQSNVIPLPSPTPTTKPAPKPTPTPTPIVGTGLLGQYYNNIGNSLTLPLPCGSPQYSRIDANIDFGSATNQLPPDGLLPPPTNYYYFGVCWTGYILPNYSETYTFKTVAAYEAEVIINGTTVIVPSYSSGSGSISLVAGQLASITIYYEGFYFSPTYNAMRLYWQSASQSGGLVPQQALFPQK